MALSVAEFVERFPEFERASEPLILSKLAQAADGLDATVWGDHFDNGHGQATAILLALSPYGAEAGLRMGAGANQRTVYHPEWERLARMVGGSYRAILP